MLSGARARSAGLRSRRDSKRPSCSVTARIEPYRSAERNGVRSALQRALVAARALQCEAQIERDAIVRRLQQGALDEIAGRARLTPLQRGGSEGCERLRVTPIGIVQRRRPHLERRDDRFELGRSRGAFRRVLSCVLYYGPSLDER